MRRDRRLWLLGVGAALLIILLAAIWLSAPGDNDNDKTERQEQAGIASPASPLIDNTRLWDEARRWNKADDEFPSYSGNPVLLVKTDDTLLYVRNNELRYVRRGSEEEKLLHFQENLQLLMWSQADGLLLGGTPEADPEEAAVYLWYYIRLPLEKNPVDSILPMGKNDISPAHVVKVRALPEPEKLIVRTYTSGYSQEYIMTPGSDTVRYLYSVLTPDTAYPDEIPSQARSGSISILKPEKFIDVGGHSILSFSNEEGLLLYQTAPTESALFYPGLSYDSVISFPVDHEGESLTALLLRDGDGGQYMAYPDDLWLFPWSSELASPGWMAQHKYRLYRLTDSRFETMSYYYVGDGLILHESALPVDQLTYQGRSGSRFDFTSKADQSPVQISLDDLSGAYAPNPQVANFQIHASLEGVPISMEKSSLYPNYEERPIPFSKNKPDRWPSHIPADLQEELDNLAGMGSGDGWSSSTFVKNEDTWYVLQYDRLSRFVPELEPMHRLEYVAELPVGVSCSVGQASACRTAEAILYADGSWFIADTYNDRLLKLNHAWGIIGEAELPLPAVITPTEQNTLSVESFAGMHTFDLELNLMSKQESGFSKVPAASETMAYISPSSYYEDAGTGLLWYYESGYVHQYRRNDGSIRSFYASHMENARGVFRIVPYKDRIIAFSDHRLLQFRQKDGRFLQAIRFDRVEPDGIYDTTPFGENSYVLDQQNSCLYLVQGYRILRIDLESGAVSELFRQNNSDIGKIALYQNSLLFTQQPGGRWAKQERDDPGLVNQLIRLDLDSGDTVRYAVPDNYYSDELSGTDLLLRLFEPYSGESAAGLRISLDRVK